MRGIINETYWDYKAKQSKTRQAKKQEKQGKQKSKTCKKKGKM